MSRRTKSLTEFRLGSVWQILGSYAVGAWLVLQLAETLSSLLGLPLWFGPTVVGLLAAGLPMVLVTTVFQGVGSADEPEEGPVEETGARRFFTWHNALFAAVTVVLLFGLTTGGYLGLRQLGVGPFGTLQAKGVIDFEERLILADFENRTPDPTLGETVTALFRIDLAQSSAITLLEPAQIAPILQRMEREPDTPITPGIAIEIAQRSGVKGVVEGEVLPLGSGFVISVRLTSVVDGTTLIAERATPRDVADIPKAVDRLSARLRERIGESLRAIQGDPPLENVTTGSLAALHDYAQAVRANDAGDYQRAIRLLEQAIGEDSTFAMAHRKLGIILTNGIGDSERSRAAFQYAYDRRDQLTDREAFLAEAAYHLYVMEDPEAAIRTYQALLDRYPTDAVANNNLGVVLQTVGRDAEAAELYWRAVELNAAIPAMYGNAMSLFGRLGMTERLEATFDQISSTAPDHPVVLRNGSAIASARFAYEEAEVNLNRLITTRRGDPVWESAALFELGAIRLGRGRLAEARELTLRAFDIASRVEFGFPSMPVEIFRAQVEAEAAITFRGDSTETLAILDRMTSSEAWTSATVDERAPLTFARLYAAAGRPDRARALIGEHDESGTDTFGNDASLAMGQLAIAEGRYQDAVEEYRRGIASGALCTICGVRELAEAYQLGGQADSAVVAYQRYLESPALYRAVTDATGLWRTYHSLGELYESQGRVEEAIQSYQRFVDLWEDADTELQPRVAVARRKITRLKGD